MKELKNKIRTEILTIRDQIDIKVRESMDHKVYEQLISRDEFKNAQSIFTFVSFKSEVDTHRFIEEVLNLGKKVCVPKIKSKETGIELYQIQSFEDLERGYFGVLEPVEECPKYDKENIDLIIMPGIAFDRDGGRVGYGGGFYDRFLHSMKRKVDKIAVAYSFQLLEHVPMSDYDVRVNQIITDQEIITINKID